MRTGPGAGESKRRDLHRVHIVRGTETPAKPLTPFSNARFKLETGRILAVGLLLLFAASIVATIAFVAADDMKAAVLFAMTIVPITALALVRALPTCFDSAPGR